VIHLKGDVSQASVPSCYQLTVNINCPDCSVVTIIGPQSFAVVRVPDIYSVIFRAAEDEVAIRVIFDLCKRSFMT
jgi:hypothetical protein